jgi:hypothetical protein
VFVLSAQTPIATLLAPVVFALSVSDPMARLLEPSVDVFRAVQPIAMLLHKHPLLSGNITLPQIFIAIFDPFRY